jgi:osmotically inducible protein OsmC
MPVERTASATWEGDLASGSGSIDAESGLFSGAAVDWRNRAEANEGKTSPEELLAAAHAACFSMALSHALGEAGNAPERLDVTATATFVGGTGVTGMRLSVKGTVPGIDADGFREAAEGAKDGCPISQALAGNVPIELEASLQ